MGLPSKRRTPRSKRERASHFALKTKTAGRCSNCNATIVPHHACPKCGMYRGRQVLNVGKRLDRARRRVGSKA